jgi:hypothetical protein
VIFVGDDVGVVIEGQEWRKRFDPVDNVPAK